MTDLVHIPRAETGMSESTLIELLSALLACDGSLNLAIKRLATDGVDIARDELAELRARHPGMYQALASERARAQEEAIAQEFREMARLSQRATMSFLDKLNTDIEEGTLSREQERSMPQIIQALAKVQQVSADKLLALTGRPSDGGTGDPLRAAADLIRLGVLQPVQRPTDPEATP